MSLGALAVLVLMLGANMAGATPVTGWVELLPDATFDGTETTNAPVVTSNGATIGANFTPTTLVNDGDFIELTGSVSFDGTARGDQFRWGLFHGDDPLTPITLANTWDGYFAQGPGTSASSGRFYSKIGGTGTSVNPLNTATKNGGKKLGDMTGVDSFADLPADTPFNLGVRVVMTALGADVTGFLNDGVTGALDLTGSGCRGRRYGWRIRSSAWGGSFWNRV